MKVIRAAGRVWLGVAALAAVFIVLWPAVEDQKWPAPPGFPPDTITTWGFHDGADWWYCRNTLSGHVWIGVQDESPEPFFRLQSGKKCGNKNDWSVPKGAISLAIPAFFVGRSDSITFVVPRKTGYESSFEACTFKLSPIYLQRARGHLDEIAALKDDVVLMNQRRLRTATQSLASFSEERLRGGGFDGGLHYCELRPLHKVR